jgi:GGDEF domain-containing protein
MKFIKSRDLKLASLKTQILRREFFIQVAGFLINALVFGALIFFYFEFSNLQTQKYVRIFLQAALILSGLNLGLFFFGQYFRKKWVIAEKEALSDEITGLMNRVCFERLLEEEVRRAGRYHYPLSLCFIDIDEFRSYNEHFGMKAGDQMLQQLARLISGNIRFSDTAARFARDEFYIFFCRTRIWCALKSFSLVYKSKCSSAMILLFPLA